MNGRSRLFVPYVLGFICSLALSAPAQESGAQNISSQKQAFAPDRMETILYGVAYYPEYMPSDQEFTNLPEPERLTPDPYKVGDQNKGAVWEEFLIPETAQVLASFDDRYWRFPAITRNQYGKGTLTYEGTFLTDTLQREIIRDVVKRAGLAGSDQGLPNVVKVRHGRNAQAKLLHYYLNFSGEEQTISYPYGIGSDLLTKTPVVQGQRLILKPWDLAIVAEQ